MTTAGNEDVTLDVTRYQDGDSIIPEFTPFPDWREIADSEHLALFYETDKFLLDSLREYVGVGLRSGQVAIAVATQEHLEGLESLLLEDGLDLGSARASGQYVELDAAQTLSQFMIEGVPDAARFTELFTGIIQQAAEGRSGIRIFGEMVTLLWVEEQYSAAIHLEELWNQLGEKHSFSLLCGYPINGFDGETPAKPLFDVCAEHSRVIPAESYTALDSADDRIRVIILLQQKARLLQAEIAERQAMEERLRLSEIHYRRLFETCQDGILIVDPETHKITDANLAAAELLGLAQVDLTGRKLSEIGLLEDAMANLRFFEELEENQSIRHEHLPLRTRDGRYRDVELVSTIYRANNHKVVQCTIHDITHRKQTEDALREVKNELELQVEDLRRLHEMSGNLTSTLDMEAVLEEVLQAALVAHGTDMGLLSLYDPEQDGLRLHVSCGLDETFLKHMHRVPAGIGIQGTCYREARQVTVEDLTSDPPFGPYHQAAQAAGIRACHSTPLINRSGNITGVLSVYFQERRRPSLRETRLVDLYARMAADFIENAQLHHELQQKLDEREQLLQREQTARAAAESTNRIKEEFLATVSHELRTPLTTIIGWTHRLRSRKRDEGTLARGLEIIDRMARAQAQLVEDVLDVSRVITGQLHMNIEPVDAASVINGAIDSVQLAAESKGIQVEVALDPSARHILGDADRLQQIFWNLLSNSIKFTPHRGRIEVRLQRAGSDAIIKVTDTGIGIAPDMLPFIFDPFRQADGRSTRRHGGLGLGLAIVRHLVELHGGTIEADSDGEGYGTTFTIKLPLTHAGVKAADLHGSSPKQHRRDNTAVHLPFSTSLENVEILLVDDDQDILQILSETLADYGATVQSAASADEAMQVLAWYAPDVLIFDLAMPDGDGYSLIARVRAQEAENGVRTPAIALTARVTVEDRLRALSSGFNMFVPKPVEPDELITVIASLAKDK